MTEYQGRSEINSNSLSPNSPYKLTNSQKD